jgi:hypothetical protein
MVDKKAVVVRMFAMLLRSSWRTIGRQVQKFAKKCHFPLLQSFSVMINASS